MTSQQPDSRLPERLNVYKELFTDSTRWADFKHRAGDIFVCTPPKCGTTWTQAICALLDEQTHRRIIKTHTPLDGIPYFEDCEYVCVYRDPRDSFFSLRSHTDNIKLELPKTAPDATPQEAFRLWLETHYEPGEEQGPSLGSITHHLNTLTREPAVNGAM